jgi:hypothetical protein
VLLATEEYIGAMNTATISKTAMVFPQGSTLLNSGRPEVILEKDQLFGWDGDRMGRMIESREGTVWLTQTGSSEDVVLSAGDRYEVNPRGRVVIQCLGSRARLRVA